MEYTGIYENYIRKISKLLTKDEHLRKDLEQEMRMALVKKGYAEDKVFRPTAIWVTKNRAIDYLRKFLKGQIPFGSMEDIDNLIYPNEDNVH